VDGKTLRIGIVLPANNKAGPQKLAAIAALDLCKRGHQVHLFIPRLPYYYYFVKLRKEPLRWIRLIRHYITDYLKHRSFSYQEIISDFESSESKRLSIINVFRTPSKAQLIGLDALLVMTIAQVAELRNLYPQEKTIYQIHHPEEIVHGFAELFRWIRRAFRGQIIAISPWTSRAVSDHIPTPPVVPDVISTIFWEQRFHNNPGRRSKDILFHFSTGLHKGGDAGKRILQAVKLLRPHTMTTVWTRDGIPDGLELPVVQNLSERELMQQYASHRLLLFPSTLEGFGMPPVEAMACGCIPIVQAGVGASDLYAQDGETALLIDPDIDRTAARIAGVLDHEADLNRIRESAYRVLDPFDPNGYGARLLEAAGWEIV